MRVYIVKNGPSNELKAFAEFIMKVYASEQFTVKSHANCTEGSRNLWKAIQSSRYFTDGLKLAVDHVIQRNGYFSQIEAIMLAVLVDPNHNVRELALHRILKAGKITGDGVCVI